MSREYSYAVMDIGVTHQANLEEVVAIMRAVGEDLRRDDGYRLRILDPLEIAGVDNITDTAVIIKCRFKVLAMEQLNVRREYLHRLKLAFDERHIEMRLGK